MNFIRSRLSIGSLLGQRCRQVTVSHRGMCNKLPDAKSEPSPPAPQAQAPRPLFRIPGRRPSDMDKKILVWAGRFKSIDQIPETVSFEMIDAARNKIRVKAAYLMMAATIGACLVMVILGKRAARRNESLTAQNMEKKARWREEVQREKAAALSEKTQ
ncbi:protein FAM162B [Acanthochromis polyacanthus]|uniref:Family with sequence similarity 162 member A n=1 Tax=Acanthochromis polyacanthus TaxID=80966 RepID=A0A3Q1GPW0_9TELE|nr:protein FAM162B [Acanthochromis polyacanthus]